MMLKVPCKSVRRQFSLSFFAAEGGRQFRTCNLCRENRQRRRQQRQGLAASVLPTASERTAEDANLLSTTNPPPRRNLTHGVLSERYHLGGRVETDTVAMAAARQEQAEIQRRHRLERRHGDDPSQTPGFSSLVARHEISQGAEALPPQRPLQSAGHMPINPALAENQPQLPRRTRVLLLKAIIRLHFLAVDGLPFRGETSAGPPFRGGPLVGLAIIL
ncbi:hypothetical protein V8E54_010655 [Elaphomyces granulatus]